MSFFENLKWRYVENNGGNKDKGNVIVCCIYYVSFDVYKVLKGWNKRTPVCVKPLKKWPLKSGFLFFIFCNPGINNNNSVSKNRMA